MVGWWDVTQSSHSSGFRTVVITVMKVLTSVMHILVT